MAHIRQFATGATRDIDTDKIDYEGFLSPLVLEEFGRYMTANRRQSDGSTRASDNWQLGIPQDQYMKSLIRHLMEAWRVHRGWEHLDIKPILCAILFNTQGYLHEQIKRERVIRAISPIPTQVEQAQGDSHPFRHHDEDADWAHSGV